MMFILFLIFFSIGASEHSVNYHVATTQPVVRYDIETLKRRVSDEQLIKEIEDRQRRIGASTEIFKDYARYNILYSDTDIEKIPHILRRLRKENYPVYEALSRDVIKRWCQKNGDSSPDSDVRQVELFEPTATEHGKFRTLPQPSAVNLNEFLLMQLKQEHQINVTNMQQQHEDDMLQKKNALHRFYFTGTVALITSIISVVQGILLARKCDD